MTIILFVIFFFFFAFSLRDIWITNKHDRVVFPFFELQRNIMSFLFENGWEKPATLSREEFLFVRDLMRTVDLTVDNYNEHKILMFNVRKMAKHLETYRQAITISKKIPNNPKIRELHERFGSLLVKAFIAYTPLIRWELALRLIVHTYRFGKNARRRRAAKYVINNAKIVRNDARQYGLIGGAEVV